MTASELRARLDALMFEHGDCVVTINFDSDSMTRGVEEVAYVDGEFALWMERVIPWVPYSEGEY